MSVVLLSSILILDQTTSAQATSDLVPAGQSGQAYSPGVMILKFKSDSPLKGSAQELFESGRPFDSVIESSRLDDLNKKYNLQKIIPLYNSKVSIDEIKEKFPERSKRIPRGAQPAGQGAVYIFEFAAKDADMAALCRQYAKSGHVEYAHPDYIMSIQGAEAGDHE